MQLLITTHDFQQKLKLRVNRNLFVFELKNHYHILIEDLRGEMMVPPAKKLEDLIHLAELCVDLLQQNEEHYAEVSCSRAIAIYCFMIRFHLQNLNSIILNHQNIHF